MPITDSLEKNTKLLIAKADDSIRIYDVLLGNVAVLKMDYPFKHESM